MKKILTVLVAVMMGTASFAQYWDHIGTPFTATDINGNTVSLADTLAAGKCVIIDYSCCWCNPCWQFHNAEILESICADATLGSQVSVMWVEIETTNTTAQITGTTTAQSYAGYTCGDWTNGGTVPYPIIDDDQNNTCLRTCASLFEGSVPSIYFIAPNGYYCDIYGYSYGVYTPPTMSLQTNLQNVANLIATYPRTGDAPIVQLVPPTSAFTNTDATFGVYVLSVDPVTSITWDFTGATPATATDTNMVTVTYANPGTYTVIVSVTNANGTVSDTAEVTVVACNDVDSLPYVEDFEGGNLGCWKTINNSTDGRPWSAYDCQGLSGVSPHSGSYVASSWSWSSNAMHADAWMISPKLNLPAEVPGGQTIRLTWWDITNANYPDHYSVVLSTNSDDPSDFTTTLRDLDTPTGSWAQQSIDLTQYAGQSIYVAFHHEDYDANYLLIDDIAVEIMAPPVSIENASNIEMSIYPNPASDYVMVNAEGVREINVLDLNGRVLSTTTQSKVDLSSLSAGVYFVRVITDNGTATEKIVKE